MNTINKIIIIIFGLIPTVFFYQYFIFYINYHLLEYELLGYSGYVSYLNIFYNPFDKFLELFLGNIIDLVLYNHPMYKSNFLEINYLHAFIICITGSIQYIVIFIYSAINSKKNKKIFSISMLLVILFIIFSLLIHFFSQNFFINYEKYILRQEKNYLLTSKEREQLLLYLLKGGYVNINVNDIISNNKGNYFIYDKFQSPTIRNEKNKLFILSFENNLNIDQYNEDLVKNIYLKLVKPNLAYIEYENKFNSMKYSLNLDDEEIPYRSYYFNKIINYGQDKNNFFYNNITCNSIINFEFKKDVCLFLENVKPFIKNIKDDNLVINSNNILAIEKYALMGEPNFSYQIHEYYKNNHDKRQYLKWLLISSQNNNKNSQNILGNILISNVLSNTDLAMLHLHRDEKDLRGQFWLEMSKK